ncbi:hypothetical protein JS530_01940 [Bifidobacterium sp. LC6]|uniref:Uncharacterized protein n=1 Tax=Bifidobacterium colobi TaxID=2809026 RepID=A0ABS5UTF3_9BIFI|nr:hypothetical protein [Bifidobacterium colobi]MBT1174282.1 hypothetical protein [Bifidobacterium colobi]
MITTAQGVAKEQRMPMPQVSNRPDDSSAEKAQASFLDHYFYPFLERYGYKWSRETRRSQQIKGIDGTLTLAGTTRTVDEKGAFHYINAELDTFSFEILSKQKEKDIGWFVDDSHVTDYYFVTWPYAKCEFRIQGKRGRVHQCANQMNPRLLTEKSFTVIEGMLISKISIFKMLEHYGWNRQKLIDEANLLRAERRYGYSRSGCDDFGFFYSASNNNQTKNYHGKRYAEEPINLLIKKSKLAELARGIYLICPEGVGVIKDNRIIPTVNHQENVNVR